MSEITSKNSSINAIITSYSVLRNDVAFLTQHPYLCVILDEGHLLKNPKTATAKAAKLLRSSHRVILSGTPVQNRVQELWAAFNFLMPNFLGAEREFQSEYGKIISESLREGEEALLSGDGRNKLKQLHQQVLPFILRREKKDVLKELPDKIIQDIPCKLSKVQKALYRKFCSSDAVRDSLREVQNSGEVLSSTIGGSSSEGAGGGRMNVLKSMLYLRLLCVHPNLVGEKIPSSLFDATKLEDSGKFMVLHELLTSSGIAQNEQITGADNDASTIFVDADVEEEDIAQEGKDTTVAELGVAELDVDEQTKERDLDLDVKQSRKERRKNKCLIFAQHTRSLDIVEKYLFGPHIPSLRYLRLDGTVTSSNRCSIAEKFNSDESIRVLLLTTKIGGLGLNLTGANMVIFLENDFNPVSDLQAMDRAHRIGQKDPVHVYRLITEDTIEEKIMSMQKAKIQMSDSIVTSDNSSMFAMGTERLLDLFVFSSKDDDDDEGVNSKSGACFSGTHFDSDELWDEGEYEDLTLGGFMASVQKMEE